MVDINDVTEFEEQLAEAMAQIEALQASAADAEARAATARSEAAELRALVDAGEGALEAAQEQLRDSASRYRAALLAGAPEVHPELVPESSSIEEVERDFGVALQVVEAVRSQVQEEATRDKQSARVPVGSPARKEQDLSSLPSSEKIRIGLQQLSEREGR